MQVRSEKAVVRGLLEQGCEVLVLDVQAPEGKEVNFVCADVTDFATMELIKAVYPDVTLKHELRRHEGLFNLSKVKRLLDWEPKHSWRQVE